MMAFLEPLRALDRTALATWVQSSTYGFPVLDAIHVISAMLVFGSIAILDLRLLRIFATDRAVTRISDQVLPWTWVSFTVAVITGCLLFVAQASSYLVNPEFQLKMGLMALAGINLAVFHFFTWNKVGNWDTAQTSPKSARIAAMLSLALWAGVIIAGRWVGWTLVASPF